MSPAAGLDVDSRSTIVSLLHTFHVTRSPRVIMALRAQDPVPDWISHLAIVKDDQLITGSKGEMPALDIGKAASKPRSIEVHKLHSRGNVLVELKNVSVSYHERKARTSVLLDLNQ